MFHGSLVALITPMLENGEIDYAALRRLVDMHLTAGTDGIIVNGTTGESAMLSDSERVSLIEHVVAQVQKQIPVIAGTGTIDTKTSVEYTRQAMELGVDACLLVTPAYVKPTQEGLYQHYATIAHSVPIPQILYNVPARTCCDLLPETVARLASIPNIIGLKEATGNIERLKKLLDVCDSEIDFYSGDDKTSLEFVLSGGKGVISVTANVAPHLTKQMMKAALQGNRELALEIESKLSNLNEVLFIESNPIPTKWALYAMGIIQSGIRLPLTILSESLQPRVRDVLKELSLLPSD